MPTLTPRQRTALNEIATGSTTSCCEPWDQRFSVYESLYRMGLIDGRHGSSRARFGIRRVYATKEGRRIAQPQYAAKAVTLPSSQVRKNRTPFSDWRLTTTIISVGKVAGALDVILKVIAFCLYVFNRVHPSDH
jgi:hypothetical protein